MYVHRDNAVVTVSGEFVKTVFLVTVPNLATANNFAFFVRKKPDIKTLKCFLPLQNMYIYVCTYELSMDKLFPC
jgi:hypothetical protein